MRAKIVDNLMDVIEEFFGAEEGHRKDQKFIELCNAINGRYVKLVFVGDDAFYWKDKNYWLPNCCWTPA